MMNVTTLDLVDGSRNRIRIRTLSEKSPACRNEAVPETWIVDRKQITDVLMNTDIA